MLEKIKNKCIKNIFFSYVDETSYGLRILFEFHTHDYLLFNSSIFLLTKEIKESKSYEWKLIDYNKDVFISDIKEDNNVNFFVKFSNGDIFYIYQRIDGLENWEQDFQIVFNNNESRYNKILDHMNEDWIEESIIEEKTVVLM